MPVFDSETGRVAARARMERLTPEERRRSTAAARRAHAVREIVEQWPELTDEQRATLSAIFAAPGGGQDGA